jgi:DNA-binding SARP family transcriptional activator
MQIHIRLLGPVRLTGPNREVSISSRRTRGLIAALAYDGPITTDSDSLIGSIWEHSPRSASVNLRTLVSELRSYLDSVDEGLGDRLTTLRGTHGGGGAYRLHLKPGECDVQVFRSRCSEGRSALSDGDCEAGVKSLESALGLWDGPAGLDLPSTTQLASRADALNELKLTAFEDLHHGMLRTGRPAEIIPAVRAMLHLNPLRERSWTHLIRSQYLSGEIGSALESFRQLRALLDKELGVEPCQSSQRLHLGVLHRDTDLVRHHEWLSTGSARLPLRPRGTQIVLGEHARLPWWVDETVGP